MNIERALVPEYRDPAALLASSRRSFVRAVAALALAGRKEHPADVLEASWRDDAVAERIVRAISNPLDSSGFPAIQTTTVLPMLSPAAASTRLLGLGVQLSLEGIATLRLPFIGGAGRPAAPAFIGEGAPAPAVGLLTSGAVLGPASKILILSAVSGELQAASAETVETVIGRALAISAEQAIDGTLFSSAAASAVAPAGLLHGITALSPSNTKGAQAVAEDLGALAGTIGANGISADDIVVVTTPDLATRLRVLASPKFTNTVLSSAMLAAGTVVGIVPHALAVGYVGNVEIETSAAAAVHFEDTAPLPITSPGSPNIVAAPVSSAYQQNLIILKIRARCAWCIQPGTVAVVEGVDW
jgi:hypothetical protein